MKYGLQQIGQRGRPRRISLYILNFPMDANQRNNTIIYNMSDAWILVRGADAWLRGWVAACFGDLVARRLRGWAKDLYIYIYTVCPALSRLAQRRSLPSISVPRLCPSSLVCPDIPVLPRVSCPRRPAPARSKRLRALFGSRGARAGRQHLCE